MAVDTKELMEQIVGNLKILSTYYKVYRTECEQRKRPVKVSQATDILANEGIDILIGALRKTGADYFAGAKRDIFELYASEVDGCLKDINAVCPNGKNDPIYTDEETGIQRLYPKPGNVLADRLRKMVQDGWALLPK